MARARSVTWVEGGPGTNESSALMMRALAHRPKATSWGPSSRREKSKGVSEALAAAAA